MNNELHIKQAKNGYILTVPFLGEGEEDTEEILIEDQDDEREAMIKMLEEVAEHFGFFYDKWGKENLNISFNKKGYKCDD